MRNILFVTSGHTLGSALGHGPLDAPTVAAADRVRPLVRADFSWNRSAEDYEAVYEEALRHAG